MLRFTVFVHLVAIPIAALWLFSPQWMVYLLPEAHLAIDAGVYLRWSLIGVPGYACFEGGKRFMQAQGNFTSGLMVLLACLPLNIFLNWFLVFHVDGRIAGAALAAALTNLIRPFLLAFYALVINRDVLQCWPSRRVLEGLWKNWGPMIRLTIPSTAMTLAEWMAFEVLTFATSYVGTTALAAQTFLAAAETVVWHLPFSISVVTSTRLGQLVGGNYLEAGKKVTGLHLLMFIFVAVIDMLLTWGLMELVIEYLAVDMAVKRIVARTLPFVVMFAFWDCLACYVHGVTRGLGWQSIGGWVTVLVNYLWGVPFALLLMLGPLDIGLRGLWTGITSGLAIVVLLEGAIIKSRSWSKVVEEAMLRQEG